MPLDAQVVNGLRIVAHPHINGDVSEILANDVEEFCDYLEQHGRTATTTKLFRMPPKIEVMAGSDQPGVNKGSAVFYRIACPKDNQQSQTDLAPSNGRCTNWTGPSLGKKIYAYGI